MSKGRLVGGEQCMSLPLIPRDVTPWLTAFKAYSGELLESGRRDNDFIKAHQFAPAFRCNVSVVANSLVGLGCLVTYLGEKVVRENE